MSVFGTRPEAIKMAPLVKELESRKEINSIVCVTAQHREMLDQVLDTFKIKPNYDLNIMKNGQGLKDITNRVMGGLDEIIKKEKPNIILVHGDTTTTFASSLAAFYNQIDIGHVEAGLRTYNKYSPFPEEMNRQMVDCLTDNHNRTLTAIRTAFSKVGGNLGVSGCVAHMFSNKTVISYEGDNADEVMELLLMSYCDVEDVQLDDGVVTIFAPVQEYDHIKEVLDENYPGKEYLEDHTTYIAANYVKMETEHDQQKYERLMDLLDECDIPSIYNETYYYSFPSLGAPPALLYPAGILLLCEGTEHPSK